MSSVPSCKQCGCSEIDSDPSRGDSVCTNCGFVLEESIIVSEVTFEEDGHGGASAVGQFVSSESRGGGGISSAVGSGGGHGGGPGGGGFHLGVAKESREITLRAAKRRISDVAQQLRLNQHCIDVAFNFFKMALHKQITKGRRHPLTIAACVYMTCRIEGTPHLLIDFSDVVQMDVYAIGSAYLQISRALYINIPAVDPCLYILRFAHKFNLGDKTHEVSMTALRLVQRMKRDWIHLGRRPSGLCGAALLIAARIHGFSKSVQDIIGVVKVHETTLRKRLVEFGETPSSSLTMDEFMSVDLEEEHDPPSFKAARIKDREQLQKLLDEGVQAEMTVLQQKIEDELEKRRLKSLSRYGAVESGKAFRIPKDRELEDTTKFIMESTVSTIHEVVPEATVKDKLAQRVIPKAEIKLENHKNRTTAMDKAQLDSILMPPPSTSGKTVSTTALALVPVSTDDDDVEDGEGELDLTGIDDSEIDGYIFNEAEAERKRVLWESLNNEYLVAQQKKKEQLEQDIKDGKFDKKKRHKAKDKEKSGLRDKFHAKNANEAIKIMLEKRMSSKINYDVLKTLSGDTLQNPTTETTNSPNQSAYVTVIESGPVVPKRQIKEEPIKMNPSPKKKVKLEPNSSNTKDPPIDLPGSAPVTEDKEKEPETIVETGPVIIESGPVQYSSQNIVEEEHYEEEDEEEEEDELDEEHSSARDLLTQFRGAGEDESNYEDDYY